MKNLAIAALAATIAFSGASAQDFSFQGLFQNDNDKASFTFTVGAPSTVTLKTLSYAGGVNATGQTIARGGFDPILSLYNSSGTLVTYNDDGGPGASPIDLSGQAWDTFLQTPLDAGSYTVFVTQYNNFGPTQLPGAFDKDGDPDFRGGFIDVSGSAFAQRDGHWAFDILNVNGAVMGGVPEPTTWALMIGGFTMVGLGVRRRRTIATTAA